MNTVVGTAIKATKVKESLWQVARVLEYKKMRNRPTKSLRKMAG